MKSKVPDKRRAERKRAARILRLTQGETTTDYDISGKRPKAMNERYLKENVDNQVRRYSDAEKQKLLRKAQKGAKVEEVRVPEKLPNTGGKVREPGGKKRRPTAEDYARGVNALLMLRFLFLQPIIGCRLIADLLIGMRCATLRRACRGAVRFLTEFRAASAELIDLLTEVLGLAVTKHRWDGRLGKRYYARTRREAVLDYRDQPSGRPYSVAEFSEVCIRRKGKKKLRFPARYCDTAAMIVGASRSQAKGALSLMGNAAVWLVNSSRPEGVDADVVKADDTSFYNPTVAALIQADKHCVRTVLRRWQETGYANADAWAAAVVERAKSRLKVPAAGDYVVLTPAPAKLRHAIRCEVLLSFLTEAEQSGFVAAEEAAALRAEVEDAFYPRPVSEQAARRIEDPDEFLPLMRGIVADNLTNIIREGERFVKKEKKLGALRTISGRTYLVMPEETWAKTYRKAAKAAELDVSFCGRDGWERELQRTLGKAERIKSTGSNPRQRYDLYENSTKDSTYVVAVLWDTVAPPAEGDGNRAGSTNDPGQGSLPPILPDASGESATNQDESEGN